MLSGLALRHRAWCPWGFQVGSKLMQPLICSPNHPPTPEKGGEGCHLPSHLCVLISLCFLADFSSFEMRPHPVPGAGPHLEEAGSRQAWG